MEKSDIKNPFLRDFETGFSWYSMVEENRNCTIFIQESTAIYDIKMFFKDISK